MYGQEYGNLRTFRSVATVYGRSTGTIWHNFFTPTVRMLFLPAIQYLYQSLNFNYSVPYEQYSNLNYAEQQGADS